MHVWGVEEGKQFHGMLGASRISVGMGTGCCDDSDKHTQATVLQFFALTWSWNWSHGLELSSENLVFKPICFKSS